MQHLVTCQVTGEKLIEPGISLPEWVVADLDVLYVPEPAMAMGSQCTHPVGYPFIPYCGPEPTEYPAPLLPNVGRVVNALIADGIADVRNVPEGRPTRPRPERVRGATVTGTPFVADELAESLAGLDFPRFYLDFECIQFVAPIWADTHPYEQLPFQCSCQVEKDADTLDEEVFLNVSGDAPMRGCAEQLIETPGETGPVLMYGLSRDRSFAR